MLKLITHKLRKDGTYTECGLPVRMKLETRKTWKAVSCKRCLAIKNKPK